MPNEHRKKVQLKSKFVYIDPAISWLSFNYRVLEEAMNSDLPLFERIRFLSIHQSNIEKFFHTAITSFRLMINLPKSGSGKISNKLSTTYDKVYAEINRQESEFETYFNFTIIPELLRNNIKLIQYLNLEEDLKEYCSQFFIKEILPSLQPVLLHKVDISNYIEDNELYLAVILAKKGIAVEEKADLLKNSYALVKIPLNKFIRFVSLPSKNTRHCYIFLEDIIKINLGNLFPLHNIVSSYSICLFRNTKLKIEDELKKKQAIQMHKAFSESNIGFPARFQFDRNIPDDLLKLLRKQLNLQPKDISPSFKYLKLSDLNLLPNPYKPEFEEEIFVPLRHFKIDQKSLFLKAIKKEDFILHFPYQTYDYILRFFNEAAIDPKVEEIRTTQYKLESNSAILSSLISASLNGKKVVIYVDFKARFDHTYNLSFMEKLTKAGIRIIPSISQYKVHAKAALIIRRTTSKEGNKKGLAYISTGNYNEKTAQLYSDHGYFTSKSEIVEDLRKLFLFMEKPQGTLQLNTLIIPKFNFLEFVKTLVGNEIKNAKNGEKASIIIKTNNLQDKRIIRQLYKANQSGVSIDILIRGICCMVPEKISGNRIHIRRIIDRFLEHSRILIFNNKGNPKVYLSSVDFIKSNIKRRIDIIVPIFDEDLKKELLDYIKFQLNDNIKGRILDSETGKWQVPVSIGEKLQSQHEIYKYLKTVHQQSIPIDS